MHDIFGYKNLIKELVLRDIKRKYRRSILGYAWSMLNPLLMMLITAMVFSNLFRFDIQNYALYLLTGQIIFTFFSESTSFSMGSILENGALLKKVYVPKYLFPISRVVSSAVNLCFAMPAMIIIMLITGQKISFNLLFCVVPVVLLFLFCIGVGLFLAAFAVYFRDAFHLYGVLLTALNYATPIFYPTKIIPVEYGIILKVNPITYFLTAFRDVVYLNTIPTAEVLFTCLIISISALGIGIYSFYKTQNNFILYI
ncbi:MAG: ABC transporter permease [Phascolarctobacterium sp.]|uniref:ABC transporter permease n=1 Tax=Phascolarctobacterium sp. TaxID=2049039 RepID=UPI0026DB823A|nr:ABC transporter permease [Phascolarctobacterium sp.]MDO4922287.1 ABC transporter permease [Phascolarctobacterium sp.]